MKVSTTNPFVRCKLVRSGNTIVYVECRNDATAAIYRLVLQRKSKLCFRKDEIGLNLNEREHFQIKIVKQATSQLNILLH